jgi:hypothetical protein
MGDLPGTLETGGRLLGPVLHPADATETRQRVQLADQVAGGTRDVQHSPIVGGDAQDQLIPVDR